MKLREGASYMVRSIIFIGLACTLTYAQSTDSNTSYIDETHMGISNKVLEWSDNIDTTISGWLCKNENNNTIACVEKRESSVKNTSLTVDAFFQSHKYFNETDNTFIRLRTDSIFQTRESHDFNLRLSIQMPFSKSKQNLKIFFDDLDLDNTENVIRNDKDDKVVSDIGIHYFSPNNYGIQSRYSLGISGVSPFVRARYSIPVKVGGWDIDPIQIFKYSIDDEFEEETNIYFDKAFEDLSLFRLQLHRKTQTKVDGMDYALGMEYYWSIRKKTGLKVSQSFFGNTKYPYVADKSIEPPEIETYGGINNYVTSISWRENIWRKWFYYEVTPIVSFHKDHDFKANYAIRIFFDFYIGQYN